MFCCTFLYVHSSIAIFLAVPRGCLRFVILVFPDHTHLLFMVSGPNTSNQQRAIKEESNVVDRNYADHQSLSVLH